jgi:mRNA-degrading endonuclease RelE of RelBE toxin-antitoxin system
MVDYKIKSSKFIGDQIDTLDKKTRENLLEKILILKKFPAHFKQIVGFPENLFRIRFVDSSNSKRLIYCVSGNIVILLCILDRSNDYKDLKKLIKKFKDDGDL